MKKIVLYLFGIINILAVAGFLFFKTRDEAGKTKLIWAAFEFTHNRNDVAENEAFIIGYNAYIYGFVRVKSLFLQENATHPKYKDNWSGMAWSNKLWF